MHIKLVFHGSFRSYGLRLREWTSMPSNLVRATPGTLLKSSNQPYDMYYYTLGHKNGASEFSVILAYIPQFIYKSKSEQEAQLPQRKNASPAHMEWAKPSSPLPFPLWLDLCVRSNPKPATNVRQACRP